MTVHRDTTETQLNMDSTWYNISEVRTCCGITLQTKQGTTDTDLNAAVCSLGFFF